MKIMLPKGLLLKPSFPRRIVLKGDNTSSVLLIPQLNNNRLKTQLFPTQIPLSLVPYNRYSTVTKAQYRGPDLNRSNQRRRRSSPSFSPTPELIKQYALPTLGLLALASIVGPLIGGIVAAAIGIGLTLAAVSALFSLSTIFLPFLLFFGGLPLFFFLVGGFGTIAGLFATTASVLVVPFILQLVLVGGGLWLGSQIAGSLLIGSKDDADDDDNNNQRSSSSSSTYYYSSSNRSSKRDTNGMNRNSNTNSNSNKTIDVEAEEIDTRARRELDEFEELLKMKEKYAKQKE
jgi:hypothetical protein